MRNHILDYEQAKEKLNEMVSKRIVKKEKDIGTTKYGFKIEHFSIGTGKKEIVITGSTHGSEIISTDFVIKLMEKLSQYKEINLDNYKFHFIPILNPEGYIISTSAIRKLIPRDMEVDEAEKICHEYWAKFRQDDIDMKNIIKEGKEPDRIRIKRHQQMFEDADYTCIPENYKELRNSVKRIYEKYSDLPKGTLQIWSANGDGIDIQANNINNPAVNQIKNGKIIYKDDYRNSNINISHPGPINCPFDKEIGFKEIEETKAIRKLLKELDQKGSLQAYYNYHGTGGILFQRLPEQPNQLHTDKTKLWSSNIKNYLLANAYKQKSEYRIVKSGSKLSSSNDFFRSKYKHNLLIELSKMGGNPIAPYGDLKNNYYKTIDNNIKAFIYSIKVNDLTEKIAEETYKIIEKRFRMDYSDIDLDKIYEILDMIYDEFANKINLLEEGLER